VIIVDPHAAHERIVLAHEGGIEKRHRAPEFC